MKTIVTSITNLSDADLISEVKRLAESERHATARLIASLMELDARRLYLAEGCASLFTYCTQVLHLSEHAAYGRIETARAARRFPIILQWIADGALTLTVVGLIASHLTPDNYREVLQAVRHKSKREVEKLVAVLQPRPDVPTLVRKLPEPKRSETRLADFVSCASPPVPSSVLMPLQLPAAQLSVVAPLAPERYKVQFTVSRDTHDKLRRAQDLLRHQIPNGEPAAIFDRALTVLVEQLERTKLAAAARPRAGMPSATQSRRIAAAVKRAVWKRDQGRCAFVGSQGRCTETGFLEFHHVVPYAAGGETSTNNLELRCRAHNAYEAECYFGPRQLPIVREHADN